MARRRKGRPINGVLLVDKPQGVSSNHVVQRVKRLYGAAKAGHTGALDPLATGLLPVCLGEATKFSQFLLDADKEYFVTAILGQRTDTSDADGELIETKPVNADEAQIKQVLPQFLGNIKQVPSMSSALKHNGRPLYYYARQGIEIEREARDITIHRIDWEGLQNNQLSLTVSCSKGTYIRSLIDDIGQLLGCGAHVSVLRRTELAHYKGEQMLTFEQLESTQAQQQESFEQLDNLLLPMDASILHLPDLRLDENQSRDFQMGRQIDFAPNVDEKETTDSEQIYRVYDEQNRFLGTAYINDKHQIQAKRVVVYEAV